ncbi:MAG: nucleotidyltransferase family protein, partial [Oscillospiraceae bacterium]|nr:nucleotidyltransferase family protein [Oscillospiraceae bacterium]
MTLQHQQFLNILRCALVNRPASCSDALTDGDWEALMELAGDQKLLPLFSDAIHTVPGTETVLPKYRPAIRRQVLVQALKTEEFLRLYRHLEQAGIRPLVVKGILLRTMYPKPDLRPSADEDLVVKPEEFAAARQALEDFGMVCV